MQVVYIKLVGKKFKNSKKNKIRSNQNYEETFRYKQDKFSSEEEAYRYFIEYYKSRYTDIYSIKVKIRDY